MKRLCAFAIIFCLVLTGCSNAAFEIPEVSDMEINSADLSGFGDINISDSYEETPKVRAVSDELYEKARELYDRYGIKILIAEECELDYVSFTAESVLNEKLIKRALKYVENALSVYPEGFLQQLHYGDVKEIKIELVGDITADNSSQFPDSYGGFSSDEGELYRMVFDVRVMTETEIYHEISHIIDARLTWDAENRDGAKFSEEEWLSLQPYGFTYAETYGEMPDYWYEYKDSGYFVMEYSCRFAEEDRATMLEAAMMGDKEIFEENPRLYDKLAYYSECIRDSFDTDGWPDVTAWEAMLSE